MIIKLTSPKKVVIGLAAVVACIFIYQSSNYNFDKERISEITGIIQIGAHTGEEAEIHYNTVGSNMIWIEAQPDKYEALKRHVKQYGHEAIQSLVWGRGI